MKNIFKKLLALGLASVMTMSLAACGGASDDGNQSATGGEAGTVYKVGICNYVDDASLNQIVDNIQSELSAIAEKEGVTFNIKYDKPLEFKQKIPNNNRL